MSDRMPPPPPEEGSAYPQDPVPPAPDPAAAAGPAPGPAPAVPAAKPPIYQRPWFIVIATIAVLGALFGGGDEEPAATPEPEASAPAPATPEAEADTEAETDADATPEPAPEATPEPEAAPEPEPEPEAEPEPEPAPQATFAAVTIEGSGDDIIDVPVVSDAPVVATFTHRGSSNFAVISYDEDGGRISLLVNEIGNYEGTTPLNFEALAAELEITADGPWTVTLSDLRDQPVYDGSASGTGDQVLFVRTGAGRLAAQHDGDSNFAILAWGDRRSLLVNEIGTYSGTVRLPDAIALEITADGAWSLEER